MTQKRNSAIFIKVSKYQTCFHPTLYIQKAQQDAVTERAEAWGQSFAWSEASLLAVLLNGGILSELHLEPWQHRTTLLLLRLKGKDSSSVWQLLGFKILIFLTKFLFDKQRNCKDRAVPKKVQQVLQRSKPKILQLLISTLSTRSLTPPVPFLYTAHLFPLLSHTDKATWTRALCTCPVVCNTIIYFH